MRCSRVILAYGTSYVKWGENSQRAERWGTPDVGTDGNAYPLSKEKAMYRGDRQNYGKTDLGVNTRFQKDPEYDLTKNYFGYPPYSEKGTHASITDRRTGLLLKYPTRKYPNPKRFKPIMVSPRVNMRSPDVSAKTLTARRYLPMEKKGKKAIVTLQYHRMIPILKRQRKEVYQRMKFGLYDLDRILPPLWGPQEGSQLDRDEWLFKLLYFVHPIKEETLCDKVTCFPHNPFDSPKEVVLSLERLVSREYCRRITGNKINNGFNLEPDTYYWTLMPDELTSGEKIVVDEHIMNQLRTGERSSSSEDITEEMCKISYQQKHNTYMKLDECNDIEALERFIAFCDTEMEESKAKLKDINKSEDFEDEEGEESEKVYHHPPQLFTLDIGKKNHHGVGHWSNSIPDKKRATVPLGLRASA